MGYRGKVVERAKARELRAQGMKLEDIATELGVSKGSVSEWVRDVEFTTPKRRYGPRVRPNALMVRKQAEIDAGSSSESSERATYQSASSSSPVPPSTRASAASAMDP